MSYFGSREFIDDMKRAGQQRARESGREQPECTVTECEHWESGSPAFSGHCSHGSCPNYMNSCPRHKERQAV